MNKGPRLLDLFSGAGGCAVGYCRAGFTEIVGVDNRPQPRYPFRFVQADALEYLAEHGREFDVIHASPPCQRFSMASVAWNRKEHPDLLTPTLDLLQQRGGVWVGENVEPAPLPPYSMMLCGLMFGLKVFRHRRFASSQLLLAPSHLSHRGKRIGKNGMTCLAGHGGVRIGGSRGNYQRVPADHQTKAAWSRAVGIDWMKKDDLAQAIPPAYTEFVGRQLLERLS